MTGLNRPLWPLLIVVLSPLVTFPITGIVVSYMPECGNDLPWWEVGHLRLALLPGVVDLVPFVWLLSSNSRVKHAAAIAGVIGIARVALPQLTLAFIAARYGGQGPFGPSAGDYPSRDPSCFVDPIMLVPLVFLMLGIFAVSAIFCVFLIRRAGRSQKPSGAGSSQLKLAVVIIAVLILFAAANLVVYLRSGEEDTGQEVPPIPLSIQPNRPYSKGRVVACA